MEAVIGLDCSTSAVKAVAFDARGRVLAEARTALGLTSFGEACFEQDPESWWSATTGALRTLVEGAPSVSFTALAIANQRETIAFLDANFHAVRPAILWLDGRAEQDVVALSRDVGAERLHRITGKTPDPNPALYKLAWMRRVEPHHLDASTYLSDVHGYVARRLTGRFATSTASAGPLGVYDIGKGCYAKELLGRLGVSPERFAEALPPGTPIGHVTTAAAETTGLPPGLLVVAGGGDGQAAGVAVEITRAGRAYLNLGTAIVSGIFSGDYRIGTSFRTMVSAGERGFVLETSLRSGTLILDWLVHRIMGLERLPDALEREAAALPAGAEGLYLLPHFLGVMTPHWDNDAAGAILGLRPKHGRAHLLRAVFEGIAQEQADVMERVVAATGIGVSELVVMGGGSRSTLWCGIIADVMRLPVLRSASVEASALGAAMAAAVGAGWFHTFGEAARAMAGTITARFAPNPRAADAYATQARRYRTIYPRLAGFSVG